MELALVAERGERRLVMHSPRIIAQPGRDGAPNRKVAALAPFVSGWFVMPLVDEPIVFVNDAAVSQPQVLRAWDSVEIQEFGCFRVEFAEVDPVEEGGLLGLALPRCTVEVRLDGELVDQVQGSCKVLIGSGPTCNLQLAEELVEPAHALLLHHEGFWYLLDLSGHKLARLGSKPARQLLLLPGDSAWLSETLELTVHFENRDLLDLPGSSSPAPPAEKQPASDGASAIDQLAADLHPTVQQRPPAEFSGRAIVVTGERLADPVCQRAFKLCQWLQQELARAKGEVETSSMGLGWLPRRGRDPVAELDRFQEMLAPNPRNLQVLQELAGYLKELAVFDMARIILKEIVRYFPQESGPLNDLALLFYEQGSDETRPDGERLLDLQRAHKYIEKAMSICPENAGFTDLHRKIDASIYILENED